MSNELRYCTDKKELVKVGDIIEFPDRHMKYDAVDLVGVNKIEEDDMLLYPGHTIHLSDGCKIYSKGSEFWKAKLVARKI